MRLSPPISVLTIVAAAFAWMGVVRFAGDCALGPEEDFQVGRFITWIKGMAPNQNGVCDVWGGESNNNATYAIYLIQRIHGPRGSVAIAITKDGNLWLGDDADALIKPIDPDKGLPSRSRSVGVRSENVHEFRSAMQLLAPLRGRALGQSDYAGQNAMMSGGGREGRLDQAAIHKCRLYNNLAKWPVYAVFFYAVPTSDDETFTITGDCSDKATKGAVERMNQSRRIITMAAGLDPSLDMLSRHR